MTDLHESFLEQKKKDEEGFGLIPIIVLSREEMERLYPTKPVTEKGRMVFETEKRSPELLWFSGDY